MDIGCLLVDILVASSWRSWLITRGDLSCPLTASLWWTTFSLWRTLLFDWFQTLQLSFLRFYFSRRTCYNVFVVFCATFLSFYRLLTLDQSLLLVPTLRPDFVANITIRLRGIRKNVVSFRLLRFCSFPCCDLHRSILLLFFAKDMVGILLYLIL